ncbi:hypothetical protein ES703_81577 [subsurface metagenome]
MNSKNSNKKIAVPDKRLVLPGGVSANQTQSGGPIPTKVDVSVVFIDEVSEQFNDVAAAVVDAFVLTIVKNTSEEGKNSVLKTVIPLAQIRLINQFIEY